MKILVVVNKTLMFFQENIIREIMHSSEHRMAIFHSLDDVHHDHDNIFHKQIDRRFSNYKKNPFHEGDEDRLLKEFPNITIEKILDVHNIAYDVVINLTQKDASFHPMQKVWSIIWEQNIWFNNPIKKIEKTRIYISQTFEEKTEIINFLEFSTAVGVCNNTAKSLFYFSYLIVKTLYGDRNHLKYQLGKKIEGYNNASLYYIQLSLRILTRKFFSKKLNWKLGIYENGNITTIKQPKKNFWADPFPIEYKNNMYVFFEEIQKSEKRGKISVLHIDHQNKILNKTTVLEEECHLSFPNTFNIGEDYYMLPEKSESAKLHLYKAKNFPKNWEIVAELFKDMKILDPVFVKKDNTYFLFFNKVEDFEYDNNERLYIYFSKDIFSHHWKSHPKNPVLIDSSSARNAGKIFEQGNTIFRPNQDCSVSYGKSLSVHEIVELSETCFKEKKSYALQTPTKFRGLHTLNYIGDKGFIDLLVHE